MELCVDTGVNVCKEIILTEAVADFLRFNCKNLGKGLSECRFCVWTFKSPKWKVF